MGKIDTAIGGFDVTKEKTGGIRARMIVLVILEMIGMISI